MRELTVKTKFLYVLQEPFSLDIPYTDRQRIVIAADEHVAAERHSRARLEEQARAWPTDRWDFDARGNDASDG